MNDDLKATLIGVSLFLFGTGLLIGAMEGSIYYDKGGCTYENIPAYFPARILGCELVKKRWPSEK